MTDIGPDRSEQSVFINNHGQIAASYFAGQITTAGNRGLRGFLREHGKRTYLSLPPAYTSTIVCGINNRGQIAGNLDDTTDGATMVIVSHAFLWQHGITQDLGAPDGEKVSEARAVNDKGEIVGRARISGRPMGDDPLLTEHHAFVYQNGQMIDLGIGEADAINNKGQIVGETSGPVYLEPALWNKGSLVKLGIHGVAVAINNSGQIVIQVSTAHSALWYQGRSVDLPPPPGCDQAQAAAINNHGWVVGTATNGQSSRATLWRNGTARCLT